MCGLTKIPSQIDMTLKHAKESFISYCQFEKKLSEKTIEAYQIDLKQFERFLRKHEHEAYIETIDKNILRSYLKVISDFKPKTIKRKVATLKALFNFLEFEDEILSNPFRKLKIKIKDPRTLPVFMNTYEVKRIFKTAYFKFNKMTKEDTGYRTRLRDIAVLELLFATGIRVSELSNLKDDQISLQTGVISINGKGGKQRLIQVCNEEALSALKKYRRAYRSEIKKAHYFFINRLGRGLSDQSIRFMIRKYTKQASLTKNVTPHTFRHTFATLLLEQGVDITYIQHFLGHSSISTTQIYTHVNRAKQKQILTTKHPRNDFELMN